MSRDVPFDHTAKCDVCGCIGAFDFYGDLICQACIDKAQARGATVAQQTLTLEVGGSSPPAPANAETVTEIPRTVDQGRTARDL